VRSFLLAKSATTEKTENTSLPWPPFVPVTSVVELFELTGNHDRAMLLPASIRAQPLEVLSRPGPAV